MIWLPKTENEKDINDLLTHHQFQFIKGKLVHTVSRIPNVARSHVYRFIMGEETYFLKSFKKKEEVDILSRVTEESLSDIVETRFPFFIERCYKGLNLDEFIKYSSVDSGLILAGVYNKLHRREIIIHNLKEKHFFYNPKTNEFKITDFGDAEISNDNYKRDDDIFQLVLSIDSHSNNGREIEIWKAFRERYEFKEVLDKFPQRRIGEELKKYLI